MHRKLTTIVLAAAALAGCGEEGPVGLDGLVPDDVVQTVEIVLDADVFIEKDTTLGGYSRPALAGYVVIADAYGGALDANALTRFRLPPSSINYVDTEGATKQDTMPTLIGGRVIARIDTTLARPSGPVQVALYRTTEEWDPISAGWEMRVDTPGVRIPWTEPGGTRGELVDVATLEPDADSLVFQVDSVTINLWADTTDAGRGALFVGETPGTQLRLSSLRLHFDARPSARPDTVVTDSVAPTRTTFIYTPAPRPDGTLLIGGIPAWRSFLQLKERLDTLVLTGPGGEEIRLGDATLNYAALLLHPVEPQAGFAPTDSVRLNVRAALGGGQIPLARAPLGDPFGPTVTLSPAVASSPGAPIELPISRALAILTSAGDGAGIERPTLVLIGEVEGDQLGVATFGATMAGARAPQLRLIVSTVRKAQLP